MFHLTGASDLGEDRVLRVVLRRLGCPVVGFELGERDGADLSGL